MTELQLQDAILRHSLEILRVAAGHEKRVETIMMELARELRDLIATARLNDQQRRAVDALIAQADEIIALGYQRAGAVSDGHALAVIVAEKTQEIMEDVIPTTIKMPSDAMLMQLTTDVLIQGSPASAHWKKQSANLAFQFAAQVRQGIQNNETQEQIVARVIGRRGYPGIMQVPLNQARGLVHSSVMSAANQARLATFRKNSRIIKGVRWLATLDGKTCPTCMAMDGEAWNLDGEKLKGTTKDFAAPPFHINDRCVLSPIPKTFKEIGLDIPEPQVEGQRASSLGPISGKTTFDEFLKRQSREFIERTLGKERAQLFEQGKITVKDLVSGTRRELTLDELRKR